MNLWTGHRKVQVPLVCKPPRRTRLEVEQLEDRTVPYAVSGNLWPHPELVRISFQPDGTNLGGVTSDLFAQFNAAFGYTATWQNVILKAAQVWAQETNVNFTVVADNGAPSGSGDFQQGDTAMGDIRIGGFNFNNSSLLALAYMPPPVNNYSVAGDIAINTGKIFNINGLDYDLFTVLTHEFGHALGLNHSEETLARLYSAYSGMETSLHADDIAGAGAIYGGRSPDALDAAAANDSFATATDLTAQIDPTDLTAVLNSLDITTTSDVDFYRFTVPSGGNGQLTVKVQSSGLSLLAPRLLIYNSSYSLVAATTGSGYLGSTLTRTVNVLPGQTYYVRVAGANTTPFGTGAYGLTLSFAGNSTTVTPPATQVHNADPINGGGGVANRRDANGVSVQSLFNVTGNTLVSATSSLLSGWLENTTSNLIGSLFGRVLGRGVGSTVDNLLELPFASADTIGDGRFELGGGCGCSLCAGSSGSLLPEILNETGVMSAGLGMPDFMPVAALATERDLTAETAESAEKNHGNLSALSAAMAVKSLSPAHLSESEEETEEPADSSQRDTVGAVEIDLFEQLPWEKAVSDH